MDLTEWETYEGPKKLGGIAGAILGGGFGMGAVILGTAARMFAGDSFNDACSKSADLGGTMMMKGAQLGDELDHTLKEAVVKKMIGG